MTPPPRNKHFRPARWIAAAILIGGGVLAVALVAKITTGPYITGAVEHELRSDYSHIRIRRYGDVRTLLFVDEYGGEEIESRVDLEKPDSLLLPYTQYMFVNYLVDPKPNRSLIVGLGGGAMVHFLKKHDGDLQLDVVEIDPAIVRIADEYFNVRSGDIVNIITADALKFLQDTGNRYDVIYLDAFLVSSDETDASGIPLHLKTTRFFELIKSRLSPQGVVVFNLHQHRDHDKDVQAIAKAFGQVYRLDVPNRGNVVVAATMDEARMDWNDLRSRAGQLEKAFDGKIDFQEMSKSLAR